MPPIGGIDLSWGIVSSNNLQNTGLLFYFWLEKLSNSSNVFNLALEGAHVLIPSFLYRIKHLVCIYELFFPFYFYRIVLLTYYSWGLEILQYPLMWERSASLLSTLLFAIHTTSPTWKYPLKLSVVSWWAKLWRSTKWNWVSFLKELFILCSVWYIPLWFGVYIAELLATTLKSDKNVDNRVLCIWGLSVLMVEEILHGTETSSGLVKVLECFWIYIISGVNVVIGYLGCIDPSNCV